jgi:hypothetical protein
LQCKICEKTDRNCLFAEKAEIRQCEKDDDLCYSWFYRDGNKLLFYSILRNIICLTGSAITVQRDCMSLLTSEYSLIKDMIGDKNSGCVKRIYGIDCFTFCSTNLCN